MKIKMTSIFLLVLFLLPIAGCATVQKKFTRKKKEPQHVAATIYMEEGPYQKKYSNSYYYKMHYALWKTWHEDLIKGIGGNRKKTERNAEESLNHLIQMRNYLVPAKQAELAPMVDELTGFTKKFESRAYSQSEEPEMRTELQKIKRLVDNDFYYDKVAGEILPDTVNLSTVVAAQASPAPEEPSAEPSPTASASPVPAS